MVYRLILAWCNLKPKENVQISTADLSVSQFDILSMLAHSLGSKDWSKIVN